MIKRLLGALAFAINLQGCATGNVGDDFDLDTGSPNGLVIFSMSVEVEDAYYQHLRLGIRSIEYHSKYLVELLGHSLRANADWDSPTARLVYLDLPAGTYQFYGWQYSPNKDCCLPLDTPIPFLVTEGTATYIGSLHFSVLPRNRAYKMEIRDMAERDVKVVTQRLSNLKPEQIKTKIAVVP